VDADFWFGVPGCDNRFSHILRGAGYELSNPSKSIASYHMHLSEQRTATNTQKHRIRPPYLYLEPTALGEKQELIEALTMPERSAVFRNKKRRNM
jgi:hypothetical protein